MTLDQFPILHASARNPVQFERAFEIIAAGVRENGVRNADLQEAKHTLSRLVENAWRDHVAEPFLHGGKWETLPQEVNALCTSISVFGLHDLIATSRKLGRSSVEGEVVDAMRSFVAEVLPLAQTVASLKDKVVKGRAPSTEPTRPANPNKVVQTCPCCFRQIAVQGEKMVHHGYRRPGSGWQTASCAGIQFQPLEVSTEGLVWLIGELTRRLDSKVAIFEARDSLTVLKVKTRGKKDEWTAVKKGDPAWAREFRVFVAQTEVEIGCGRRELLQLDGVLLKWTPQVQCAEPMAA